MAIRRHPGRFDVSSVDLDGTGDVRIGAYARRQLRKRILIGILGAGLFAGAVTLYAYLRPATSHTSGRIPYEIRCLECGYTAQIRAAAAQKFPIRCPRCQAITALPLWQCRSCGHRFVPEQTDGVLACPVCASESVGSAAAQSTAPPGDGVGP